MAYLYKSAEFQDLERRNLDRNIIDIDTLLQYKKQTIASWLYTYSDEIMLYTIQKLQNVVAHQTPSVALPSHVRNYILDDLCKVISIRNRQSTQILQRALPVIAYHASNYDVSCHEILFRNKFAAQLPRRVEQFMKLLRELPSAEKRAVLSILRIGREDTHNLQYILKLRLQELSAERGVDVEEVVWGWYSFPTYTRNIIATFLNCKATPTGNEPTDICKNGSELIMEGPMLSLIYLACIVNHVSADRLLLQDYSRFAAFSDGSLLNEEEQKDLSVFLRASPLAQDLAINHLAEALIGLGLLS